MSKPIGMKPIAKLKIKKRTSIGVNAKPTNKSARPAFKAYRGQGRP